MRSRFQQLALGVSCGATFGYAAMRTWQAARDVRHPAPAIAAPDPTTYGAYKRRLMVADLLRSAAGIAATAFAIADPLERRLRVLPRPLRASAFVAVLTLAELVRELPVGYVESFMLERLNRTSEQDARTWLGDQLKSGAIGLVVVGSLTAIGDTVVRRAPRSWPWVLIAGTPVLLMLANVVAPTFIMPLFNKYTKLDGPLEGRIRALAAQYGAGSASILRFDMSRQTKKANAFVTGVFGTERIVLADTLIDNFAEDETMFVVAHELGHYVRRDPWISVALGTAFMAATILIGKRALASSGRQLETAADGARFAFYAQLITTVGSPLLSAASRAIERRADRFAIAATDDPLSGARAFRRLREQNLAEDEAPKWAELLFASHPSLKSRIERLEAPR